MKDLANKIVVVTGAGDGIGKALAEGFAAEGARLVLGDIEATKVEQVGADLLEQGTEVLTAQVDVSRPEDLAELRDAALARFGDVHVLCNNAGVMGPAGDPLWELPPSEWQRVMAVNFFGVLHGIQAFLPSMLAAGDERHILNTASMAGVSTGSVVPEYIVSKHAVVALSEVLHAQLAERGANVGITILCPSAVTTHLAASEQQRLAEIGDAERWAVAPQSPGSRGWGTSLTPAEVAAAAIDGVRRNRHFVFTHAGSRARIDARIRPIYQALDIDEARQE
jgi:NAD(P)-dependent dehydrogenase (short-subunit alcohol dehydrogenase family)